MKLRTYSGLPGARIRAAMKNGGVDARLISESRIGWALARSSCSSLPLASTGRNNPRMRIV
jgi:hypothetical protein